MPEPPVLWVFLHLPKTGGTTFEVHLHRHLTWDETFVNLSRWGRTYRREHGRPHFADRPEAERRRVRVLSGHHTYWGIHRLVPGATPRYVTFVRDPAARLVSHYNFRRSRAETDLPFEQWYEQKYRRRKRNAMTRFYAERLMHAHLAPDEPRLLDLARTMLDECWLVGLTERLDDDLRSLFGAMGLPTEWEDQRRTGEATDGLHGLDHPAAGETVRRYVTLDSALRARLHADHPLDVALYRHARALHAALRPASA